MQRRTKIIATIGPASDTPSKIESLIRAGTNLFRFNMKHNTPEWHSERIKRVQKEADKLGTPVGIIIDLQGFEIRIGTREEKEFSLEKGEVLVFGKDFLLKEAEAMIFQEAVFEVLNEGDEFLLDDGHIAFEVKEKKNDLILAEAKNDGVVRHRKSMNIPGKRLNITSLVESDIERLDKLTKDKVDFVALSFVRSKKDIAVLREELEKRKIEAGIIAKIESREALDNIDEIISAADAVMVARGDLGVEIPIGELAFWQRQIITKCRKQRKAVIIATQMLYSMVESPRPTRAEATDVANAVFCGTDAVMLSEETAMGKFSVEVVEVMRDILKSNEQFDVLEEIQLTLQNPTDFIISAAASMTNRQQTKPDMAVVFTQSGYSAKTLSAYRAQIPIIALTDKEKTAEILTLYYGIHPICYKKLTRSMHSAEFILERLKEKGIALPQRSMLVVQGQHKRSESPTENALSFVTF